MNNLVYGFTLFSHNKMQNNRDKERFMDVYSELKVALGEVNKVPVTKRPVWIIKILKNLEHMFGEEVLEYMFQVIGVRLKTGRWSAPQG